MLSSRWLLAPFVLQGIFIAIDEFYFHWRRGLPRWERLGHPLDTLSVVLSLGWLCFQSPSPMALAFYVFLSLLSCLCVTKDEFVHAEHCGAREHWLHAVLFVLHPLVLIGAGMLWAAAHGRVMPFIATEGWELSALHGNAWLALLFGIYQFVYWNWLWMRKPRHVPKVPSTTKSITG